MANKRTAYWRDKAQTLREKIVNLLGGKCVTCNKKKRLELDHIDPNTRTWEACKLSQMGRARRYWKEFQQGLLQVLCRKCNSKKGNRQVTTGQRDMILQ